mmetsp:Transcript_97526/g.303758  ORF Transcript_97526/g.303758 Transcript_97526/m.303758 type:complete len:102 (-) Transcript_97526:706-1011(-)
MGELSWRLSSTVRLPIPREMREEIDGVRVPLGERAELDTWSSGSEAMKEAMDEIAETLLCSMPLRLRSGRRGMLDSFSLLGLWLTSCAWCGHAGERACFFS